MQYIIGLLGVLFVGLKLTGFISWSWWLVTLPFWGGLAAFLVIWIIAFACIAIGTAMGGRSSRKW